MTNELDLDFCEQCYQMTNHLYGVCQKCMSNKPSYISTRDLQEIDQADEDKLNNPKDNG